MRRALVALVLVVSLPPAAAPPSRAQQPTDWSKVEIKTEKVADGVWMLSGRGGNIAVSAGADGVFLGDGEFAPLTERIVAAVRTLSDQPVRWLLDTHWHGDHVGSNENLARAGALVIAHENVRERMSHEEYIASFDRKVPASPAAALPRLTFRDTLALHVNGDTLLIVHIPPAHTDGDAVVWFERADVLQTGDLFFNGLYPVIDISNGGSIDGMIRASDLLLARVGPSTRIIPGHGPLGDRAALQRFHDMLVHARAEVWAMVDKGMTVDAIVAAKPTADLDAVWGQGGMPPEVFDKEVAMDLVRLRR